MDKFYRTNENYIDRGTLSGTQSAGNSNWLNDLAESLLLKESIANSKQAMESALETNAVEVSRKRQQSPSVYEMMSSIVYPHKPKFSSVEEVVQDYQNRTGLAEHIKQKEAHAMKAIAQKIMGDSNDAKEVKTTITKEIFDKDNEDGEVKTTNTRETFDKGDCNHKTPNPFRTNMDYGDTNDASGKLSQKDLEELKSILYPTHGQKSVSEISDIHKHTDPKVFEHMTAPVTSPEKSNADDGEPSSEEEDLSVSEEDKSVIESLKQQKQKFEEKKKKIEEQIQQKQQSGSEALKKLEEDKKDIERLQAEIKQIQDVNSVFDGAMEKAKKKKNKFVSKKKSSLNNSTNIAVIAQAIAEDQTEQEDQTQKPPLFEENPAVYNFIVNTIETNHGIQIPALIHAVMATFSRDGLTKDQISDPDVLRYINQIIIEKNTSSKVVPSNIGKNLGTSLDNMSKDLNKDPFTLLTPAK